MHDPHLRTEALEARDNAPAATLDDEDRPTAEELEQDRRELDARRRRTITADHVRCPDGWTRRAPMAGASPDLDDRVAELLDEPDVELARLAATYKVDLATVDPDGSAPDPRAALAAAVALAEAEAAEAEQDDQATRVDNLAAKSAKLEQEHRKRRLNDVVDAVRHADEVLAVIDGLTIAKTQAARHAQRDQRLNVLERALDTIRKAIA